MNLNTVIKLHLAKKKRQPHTYQRTLTKLSTHMYQTDDKTRPQSPITHANQTTLTNLPEVPFGVYIHNLMLVFILECSENSLGTVVILPINLVLHPTEC